MSTVTADSKPPFHNVSTFHLFPRLALELRLAIWEMTVEPREVAVRIVKPKPTPEGPSMPSWSDPTDWLHISEANSEEAMKNVPTSTRAGRKARQKAWDQWKPYHPYVHLASTIPATLHTCREARNYGLYKKIYLDGDDQPPTGRRYAWLNLDIDLIHIGTWNMAYFLPIAASIKRLKLSREIPDEFDHKMDMLSSFINAEKVHLVCIGGFTSWGDQVDSFQWPCPKERLVFIDEHPWTGFGDVGPVGYRELKRLFRLFWSEANSLYDTDDWWSEDDGFVEYVQSLKR